MIAATVPLRVIKNLLMMKKLQQLNNPADNITHAVVKCKEEIGNKKQTLTLCRVGSHNQNGKAEIHIIITCDPDRSVPIPETRV